jgi:lysophospholipase L1-like esterase
MKIVILADSLALPREEDGNKISYEATYPFLLDQSLRERLKERAPLVIERGMRRRTIEYVLDDWLEMVELRRPEVVVVHVGIVDCAPRVFLRREGQLVEKVRPARLKKFVFDFVHRHRRRIIELRPRVYVDPVRFRNLVKQVIQKARACDVRSLVFINIIVPPEEMEKRSPGFQENVLKYNRILNELVDDEWVSLIDLNSLIAGAGGATKLTVDGIHINETGHEMLAQELETYVLRLLGTSSAASSI